MSEPPACFDAVLFDIGGIIVDLDSVKRAQRAFVGTLLAELTLEQNTDTALRTWRQAVGDHFRDREQHTFLSADEGYHRAAEAIAGEPVPRDVWRPLFDQAFVDSIEPVPGIVSTVETLAGRDRHIGVVSDIDTREGRTILAAFGLESRFDSVTTSEDVGWTKPAAEIFEVALDRAGSEPERSLMVGDRYKNDMLGGRNAGIWTAGLGVKAGPAVDYHLEDVTEVLSVVDSTDRS